ncbi:unnamed protein product [Ceutorhynchus assimilis]|uniref:DUF4806 domain-containing protein n=1 Tax=Ceutorhynchus assimilis TaxID=467358 RepID=A0A9N9MAI8_9CUCU|nr:unnamed protein product [Ceutorhynchus assimilis]
MSFKIVQTREPGHKLPSLSIVPSAWEKDGTLFWPPAKKKGLLFKIIRDGNSRPETDWVPQPCTKKRQTFLSYEAADLELTAMQTKSDSEGGEPSGKELPKQRLTIKKRKEIGRVPAADFNLLAEECKKATEMLFGEEETTQETVHSGNQSKLLSMPINKRNVPQIYTIFGPNEAQSNLQTIKIVNNPSSSSAAQPSSNFLEVEEDNQLTCEVEDENLSQLVNLCLNNQNTVMENQKLLLENQLRIMEQLSSQETILQMVCENVARTKITASTNATADEIVSNKKIPNDPLPIDSMAKLEKLEIDLRDESFMNQIIKCKSYICGSNGKMNGMNCSYRLIDHFFKRQFLMQFSWSGGSRKDEHKVAFKKFKNVMTTFYKIISRADSQFTEAECEIFFKGVIKNAKRRFELRENSNEKKNRASSAKKRPKNLTYRKVNEIDSGQEEADSMESTEEAHEEDEEKKEKKADED